MKELFFVLIFLVSLVAAQWTNDAMDDVLTARAGYIGCYVNVA